MEVGTSNFDTLIGQVSDGVTGMSVEAMPFYVEQLPVRRGVVRVNAAVVGEADEAARTGYVIANFVHPDNITKYGLPRSVRGCSTIGEYRTSCAYEVQKARQSVATCC